MGTTINQTTLHSSLTSFNSDIKRHTQLHKVLRNTQLSSVIIESERFVHEPGGYVAIDNFNVVTAASSEIKRNFTGS